MACLLQTAARSRSLLVLAMYSSRTEHDQKAYKLTAPGVLAVDQQAAHMLTQAASLQRMLQFVSMAHRSLASRHLALHKATAKLCFVSTALLAGVVQQGFCTAPETSEETEAGEGGSFKEAEGTVRLAPACFQPLDGCACWCRAAPCRRTPLIILQELV